MYSKPSNEDFHVNSEKMKPPCAFNATAFQNPIRRNGEIAQRNSSISIVVNMESKVSLFV